MKKFDQLLEIMQRLRKECPWDKKQTAQTLRQYLLEEVYEVIETIDEENWPELKKELGDLLLQIVFHSTIADEKAYFDINDVLESINSKLIERHPHVFGNRKVNNADEVENNWEHIKIRQENRESLLTGIPIHAPALLRAQRMQEKASRVGFDWQKASDVIDKLQEEIFELKEAINEGDLQQIESEIGDLLFSIVNLSRFMNVVAEDALRSTNRKFIRRFRYIEKYFDQDYSKIKQAPLNELDKIWDMAKKQESE